MNKIIYQQPRVIVHIICPEELLQNVNTSDGSGDDAGNADAKFHDFDDDDDDLSYGIWED